jgi:hypothetical protein
MGIRMKDVNNTTADMSRDEVLYCTHTIGSVIRKLNSMCVEAFGDNDDERAVEAARHSAAVQEAMVFAGVTEAEEIE